MKNLVVKDNALIEASYKLSLVEQRLILMAIVEMRKPLDYQNKPREIVISASDYARHFDTHINTAYQALQDATKDLMARQFTFIDIVDGKKIKKTSRWVSEIGYGVNEAVVTMKFAPAIMPLISELERRFTSYSLDRIASLNSAYAVRLYELLIQWRSTGLTPLIKLDDLRQKLGVEKNEYPRMTDFKKRVLDLGIEQINEHTDITAKYKQIKKGREIVGFEFSFKEKSKPIDSTSKGVERDPTTADMFLEGLTDKQLARAVHSKKFINDYNGLVSAQNPANQSSGAWVAHMVEWLKKDPSNFAKRPMQEYLDDEQAQRF
jgi:plasmid replication initiation protein